MNDNTSHNPVVSTRGIENDRNYYNQAYQTPVSNYNYMDAGKGVKNFKYY
jgi:hypothetical protein